ncbi:protein-L-isoaspartate O-methyltransferase [Acidocella sp.]|uniref:protein-L-isoaspartate O-methyltransferase family protein n=1 Tax=Acidocella sp. TaxID=50710 RepID=UPI00260EFB32|nr:protein-L-isoaspartate(D-aspartate) O-methyltransferase [Acidocella sp.]
MTGQTITDKARANMVDSQVRPNHVHDERVIAAMRALPREAFAPSGALPYADADIALGQGRYLAAPMLTARLAQLALAQNPAHVLVVGAGSGYLAAILSHAGVDVVALEAESRLDTGALAAHAPKVERVSGPLEAGWPAGGPFDVILVEGAIGAVPPAWVAQLAKAGRVVAVLADDMAAQGGLGRAVLASPAGEGFAAVWQFDTTARPLPAFRPAPAFAF